MRFYTFQLFYLKIGFKFLIFCAASSLQIIIYCNIFSRVNKLMIRENTSNSKAFTIACAPESFIIATLLYRTCKNIKIRQTNLYSDQIYKIKPPHLRNMFYCLQGRRDYVHVVPPCFNIPSVCHHCGYTSLYTL